MGLGEKRESAICIALMEVKERQRERESLINFSIRNCRHFFFYFICFLAPHVGERKKKSNNCVKLNK